MYQRDCKAIAQYVHKSPRCLIDMTEFTLCTINMPLSRVHLQRESIRKDGLESKWLSKHKRSGMEYIYKYAEGLHGLLVYNTKEYGTDSFEATCNAVNIFSRIPSIGIVKAGFMAQMCGYNVACLDRHNLRDLGLPESAFLLNKKSSSSLRSKKISDYVELCREKGSEYWWNWWCNFVAERGGMNKSLPTGDAVSRYHATTIMGGN